MKTKKEMPQQESDKAPVTFQDVAACFSDEEWKLLHKWQKELYNNVMKEIHQAWISLGPVIATSVFSLRVKEKEHLSAVDNHDSESRHCNSHSSSATNTNSDVFRISREEQQYLKHHQDTDVMESRDHLSTGFPSLSSDVILRMEQEVDVIVIDDHASGVESSTSLSSGHNAIIPITSFGINEEGETYNMTRQGSARRENVHKHTGSPSLNPEPKPSFMEHVGAEKRERITSSSSGHSNIPEVVLVCIKEEEETYCMDHQDSERIEHISSLTDNGGLNKQNKTGESLKCTKKTPPCQATFGKPHASRLDNSHKGTHARIQVWSESNQTLNEEKSTPCESAFGNVEHLNLHQGSHKLGRLDKYDSEHKLRNSQFLKGLPNTPKNQRLFACTECDKGYSLKGELVRHMITHSGVRPYACTECEKSFFQMPHLIRHFSIHSGEKPYACRFCHKRFNRKDNLNGHERLHTGEKPYYCNQCDKSFIRKSELNEHRRIHT